MPSLWLAFDATLAMCLDGFKSFDIIMLRSACSIVPLKVYDQRLVLFYKIINGLASVETEDILTPADSRTRKNHSFKFKHLQANCDSCRYSFFPATISSWNNLPFGIEKVDSVEGFKLKLKEHTFRSP